MISDIIEQHIVTDDIEELERMYREVFEDGSN